MSRSGYTDDYDDDCDYPNAIYLYRSRVERIMRGERGQMFLRGLLAALDAMPVKELIAHELVREDGAMCALGALGTRIDVDLKNVDPEDAEGVASRFKIAAPLVREVTYENDDEFGSRPNETPAERWQRMREWVAANIVKETET